ncbi:hypothetical protein HKX48_000669 [Thoreauomyces humboldtii]|nr:hypothetical protein HKX48_000669 [Thoreauomyces humboldtii]
MTTLLATRFVCDRCTASRLFSSRRRKALLSFRSFLRPPTQAHSKPAVGTSLSIDAPPKASDFEISSDVKTGQPTALASKASESQTSPFSKLANEDDQELYDNLTESFLERLRGRDGAQDAWEDYSKLVASTLDNIHLSVSAHHRLFQLLNGTPAALNGGESKANAMSSIVRGLASAASVEEYDRLIELHDKQNSPTKIQTLINEMRRNGLAPSHKAYNHLIGTYVRNNDMRAAVASFESFRRDSSQDATQFNATTYSLLIRGHLNNSSHFAADRLFREMRALGFTPSVSIYNGLMLSLVRRGRNAATVRLFDEMRRSDDVQPNLASYRLCIAANANSRNNAAVAKSLDDMLASTSALVPRPDYAIWKIAIRAFVIAGDTRQTLAILRKMQSLAEKQKRGSLDIDVLRGVVRPGADIFETVIDLCCRSGELATARDLLEEALAASVRPHAPTWNTMILALAKSPGWHVALDVYRRALTQDVPIYASTYAALITSCSNVGELDTAAALAQAAYAGVGAKEQRAVIADVFRPLIAAFVRKGRLSDALALVRSTFASSRSTPPLLAGLFANLIAAYSAAHFRWDEIMGLFDECEEVRHRSGGTRSPSTALSNALLRAACSTDPPPTRLIAAMIESNRIFPSVSGWVEAVDVLFDRGLKEQIGQLMNELAKSEKKAAKVGTVVLDVVMDRLDPGRKMGRPDVPATWPAWSELETEQVMALLARWTTTRANSVVSNS